MSKYLKIALALQVLIMVSVLIPPMITKATGTEIFLETERVDPRALFRGDYVVLDYPIGDSIPMDLKLSAQEKGSIIYVKVTTDRPAAFISAALEKPSIEEGTACVVARTSEVNSWDGTARVRFPQISQFFVPEGTGGDIERDLNTMVAKMVTTKSCNAVLLDLEYL